MSNSFDTTSGPVAALWDTIPQVAYAMARGKDGMSDSANDMFTIVATGNNVETTGMAGAFYREVRTQAERIATSKGKPLKEQNSKSFASQVSKLENFPLLGECARINSHVAPAFEYAREVTGSGYTKLVKAAVALKTVLAKDINADEPTLCEAVDASQAEKPEVASEVIAKMSEALHKLVHGDEKNEPKHAPLFTALLATYPADYVERARQALTTLATCVAAVEAATAAKIATSK